MRAIFLFAAVLILGACVNTSAFHPPVFETSKDGDKFFVQNPHDKILLIYTLGSSSHNGGDVCRMDDLESRLGLPKILQDMAGVSVGGKEIVVYGYCSSALGQIDWNNGQGISKPDARAKDIEILLTKFVKSGVPKSQIFVAGHSIGGWTALILARNEKIGVAGALAFAPALAGRHCCRSQGARILQERSIADLKTSERMNALVYAFDEDPFNLPEHISFLGNIPGTEFVQVNNKTIDGVQCESNRAHSLHATECFRKTQKERILSFLTERLTALKVSERANVNR